jgi:hypothetical protein
LLQPYQENEVYGENYIRPLPDIEEGEEVYEVEQILRTPPAVNHMPFFGKLKSTPNLH